MRRVYIGAVALAAMVALAAPIAGAAGDEGQAEKVRAEMWVDLYTGEPVAFAEVLEDLAQADVVFLGERHTVARHHERQLEVVKALAGERRPLVLGLEMMEKRFQPELDRYGQGSLDFEGLAEATAWSENWNNYEDYRAVVEAAREAGGAILALNADAGVIRKIGREGLDALTPEERGGLPEMLMLDDPPYFALLDMQLMVHAKVTEENLRNIFAAQVARDEAMAAAMAEYLASEAGRDRRAIVLCGAGHCAYGYGTAARLQKRLPEVKVRIVIMSESGDVEIPEAMRKHVRDIEISHQQLRDAVGVPLGDYVCVVEPRERVAEGKAGAEEK